MNETPIRSGSHSVKKGDKEMSMPSSTRAKLAYEESPSGVLLGRPQQSEESVVQESDIRIFEPKEKRVLGISSFSVEPDGVRSPFFGMQPRKFDFLGFLSNLMIFFF